MSVGEAKDAKKRGSKEYKNAKSQESYFGRWESNPDLPQKFSEFKYQTLSSGVHYAPRPMFLFILCARALLNTGVNHTLLGQN
jgi:hypothetical protein